MESTIFENFGKKLRIKRGQMPFLHWNKLHIHIVFETIRTLNLKVEVIKITVMKSVIYFYSDLSNIFNF